MMRTHWPQVHPPGLRVQLTLWYIAVSATLMVLCATAFYMIVKIQLETNFDTALRLRTQQIAQALNVSQGRMDTSDIAGQMSQLGATAAYVDTHPGRSKRTFQQEKDVSPGDFFVRVLDEHSQTLYETTDMRQLTLNAASVHDPLHGVPWRGTVYDADGRQVRVYCTMLVWQNQIIGVIQVGQSLESLNEQLQSVLYTLIGICSVLLLVCGLCSYWFSARAFKPIHHLARTARTINAQDLQKRVPLPRARDEVYDLALLFNQMIGRLERAFEHQRRFVADASHELRTPVAVIRNMTEVALSRSEQKEEYIQALEGINEETERLGRLINDLLALARADEQKMQLDYEPVRLDFLAADALESMESLAEERQVSLASGVLQAVTVMGDAARLIQIILSLLDNALKYTNAGGKVAVSVDICDDFARLCVQDTGIGISPEEKPHIFERFYRADPARSKAVGGYGLGLSIVEMLVRLQHGTVAVESEPGKGTMFIVMFPRASETAMTGL